jgi:hypothetical protein
MRSMAEGARRSQPQQTAPDDDGDRGARAADVHDRHCRVLRRRRSQSHHSAAQALDIPEAVAGGLLAAVLTLIAYVGLGIEIGFSLDARVMRRDKSPSRLMFLRCSRKSLPTQQCHGEGRRGRKEVMATFIVICQ